MRKDGLKNLWMQLLVFVILDNGSTDDTVKICKSFPKVTKIIDQHSLPFDDTRDKNTLLKTALESDPDFVLTLDGDEVLQIEAKDLLFEELTTLYPDAPVFEFEFLYMWDKPNQYRYDGSYSMEWFRRLLRISAQPKDLKFDPTNYDGNAHCPHIPQKSVGWDNYARSRKFFTMAIMMKNLDRKNSSFCKKPKMILIKMRVCLQTSVIIIFIQFLGKEDFRVHMESR